MGRSLLLGSLLVALGMIVTACQASSESLTEDPGELRGDWTLLEIDGVSAEDLNVVVTFDDGSARTDNVCNPFAVPFGYGETVIQHQALTTTVTSGGVGCLDGTPDRVDNSVLGLLYFNTDPIGYDLATGVLELVSGSMSARLIPNDR
ncbi:MAG: hypothetical protein M3112_11995 [Actinomycetia bacterium]|nr:hypothetical protein [Actinomycetes bacterium]